MEVHNLNSVALYEARGLAKCWEAYSQNATHEEVMVMGFNDQTGYVYLMLENGITICSQFGKDVEFIIFDCEADEELFFDDYDEAYNNSNVIK